MNIRTLHNSLHRLWRALSAVGVSRHARSELRNKASAGLRILLWLWFALSRWRTALRREPIPPTGETVDALFDQVYALSLPRSVERRERATRYLREFGIRQFSWFDATDADDPLVKEFYGAGRVMRYPPCFRCGKKACGRDDCNNVLIAPQVATALSYFRLMQVIAAGSADRVLIVEDDVVFEPYAPAVLCRLLRKVESGEVDFCGDVPVLLRMSSERGHEHVDTGTLALHNGVRMSNHCFAVTRSFAEAVVKRFQRIETTADIFLHDHCRDLGTCLTLFPLIASDLSWSAGAMPSEIHPKEKHAQYLRRQGRTGEAEAYLREKVVRHVDHLCWRPMVITGHPRCGSAFAADLCNQLGVKIGHERVARDGISSWMFAVNGECPFARDVLAGNRERVRWKYLVLYVRDLRSALPSVMREHTYAPDAGYEYLRRHILDGRGIDLNRYPDPAERAAWSIILWTDIVYQQHPDLVFRIEDQADLLEEFLRQNGLVPKPYWRKRIRPAVVNADKLYQGYRRTKPTVDEAAFLRSASPELGDAMRMYSRRFGYDVST
jgi:GR25 family glycosyltransferase involved in LPS biosynthesis